MRLVKNALLLLVVFVAFSGVAEAFAPASYTPLVPLVPPAEENVFEINASEFKCEKGHYLKSFSFDSQVCEPVFPICSAGEGLSLVNGSWRCEAFDYTEITLPRVVTREGTSQSCPQGQRDVISLETVGSVTNGQDAVRISGAEGLFVEGNYAYVASDLSDALQIIKVKDDEGNILSSPEAVGNIVHDTDGAKLDGANSVYIKDNYAYVTSNRSNALQIIDIRDPASLIVKGSVYFGDNRDAGGARDVFVKDNYAYVVGGGVLRIIDIEDPENPETVTTLDDQDGEGFFWGLRSVVVRDNYAYIVSYNGQALQIIDIRDPENPTVTGRIEHFQEGRVELYGARDIAIQGNYAYIPTYTTLTIIDISNPEEPSFVGGLKDGNKFSHGLVSVDNDNLFFVDSNDSLPPLQIVNVNNPSSPKIIHSKRYNTNIKDIVVSGDYMFMVGGASFKAVRINKSCETS